MFTKNKLGNKLGIIGCGNLSSAIIEGLITSNTLSPEQIIVYSRSPKKLEKLKQKFKFSTRKNISELISSAEYLALAVKPKDINNLLIEISDNVKESEKLKSKNKNPPLKIISFIAGLKINSIKKLLPSAKIARVMINLSVADSLAATGIFSYDKAFSKEIAKLFNKVGCVTLLRQENKMNAFAALSACAPAYLSLAYQGLYLGGIKCGLDNSSSKEIVDSLFKSLPLTLERNNKDLVNFSGIDSPCALLRKKITTPGGMTEAGFYVLDAEQTISNFSKALVLAEKKANELGKDRK